MSIKGLKEYLLSLDISKEDRGYVSNFCKKLNYFEKLREMCAADTNDDVEMGYGDANAKICFVFKDKETFYKIKGILQKYLDEVPMNYWDIWVTFIDKTHTPYSSKLLSLGCELYAIGPKVIYVFSDDIEEYHRLIEIMSDVEYKELQALFFIEPSLLDQDDPSLKNRLWKKFMYLFKYKA